MASQFAQPPTTLPHAHRQHLHSHSQSHSSGSFDAFRSNMASSSPYQGSTYSHSRSQSHDMLSRRNGSQDLSAFPSKPEITLDNVDNPSIYSGRPHHKGHGHSHSLSSSISSSRAVSRKNSSVALHQREDPSSTTFSMAESMNNNYAAPTTYPAAEKTPLVHDHDHDHSHGHHHHDHDHHHDHKHSHTPSGGFSLDITGDHRPQASLGAVLEQLNPFSNDRRSSVSAPSAVGGSLFTRVLLKATQGSSIIHTILSEKDSRRIFYFLTLNFGFMGVQGFYAYATSSLGLLSDTVHMFFDCFALLVGLCAAIMSKWPPSQRYPYGLGKVETLSGFANGVLLMLLSIEIIGEAAERVMEGTPPKRLQELLTISILGGLVNAVGLFGFGHHHHHGHDHGHSCPSSNKKTDEPDHHHHGHGHGHSHSHSHSHHDHDHHHDHHHDHDHAHDHGHGHGHSHHNENMEGIFLHVMADLMGSVAVVFSTIMTMWTGWPWWDAVAGIAVSVLIAMAAWPLLKSSARNLLLSIPESTEYNLRNTLAGIHQQRGVVSYSVPKFWVDDISTAGGDRLKGIVHVVAGHGAALDDVRERVRDYLMSNGMDIVVQVEREGDGGCWCGAARLGSPMLASPRAF